MRDRRLERTRGGFTLIEVVVTIGILGFGLLTIGAMQLHAMRGGSRGRHGTEAAAIAQTQMEVLQRMNWTSLGTTTGFTAPINVNTVVQDSGGTQTQQSYAVDWNIADVVANFTRSIDVRVSWTEPRGPARDVTISSMRFNREGL